MYDSRHIANLFIQRGQFSHMQIQKLVYFSHGWSLAILDKRLVDENFQAWRWGPVLRSVYESLRSYGYSTVTQPISSVATSGIDPSSERVIERTCELYGSIPALRLSRLTHVTGGPWHQMRMERYQDIPDRLIRLHFKQAIKDFRRT